jgi:hypothetical protein
MQKVSGDNGMIITEKQINHLIAMVQNYIFVCKQMDWHDIARDANMLLKQIRDQQSEELKEVE